MGMESAALLGTGILSNVFTSALTDQYNQDQFNRNLRLQKDAQAYNTTMYVRQRDDQRQNYQTMLADQRANYNTMRSDMENFYNKYQTPTAMAKQLRASGINPAAVFGSGQGIQAPASMPAMSSPQMSSPSASSSPLASLSGMQNPYQNYATLLPHVTSALKDISSSGLQDAQTQEVQTLLQQKLYKLMADVGGQEALNTQLQLENEITKAFGKKKAAAEIKSLTEQAFLYAMSGKTEKAKAALTSIQEKIGEQNLKIDTERALVIAQLLKKQLNFIDEQTNTEKAKQNELGASAKEHLAGAGLKNLQSRGQEIANNINGLEEKIKTDPQYVKSVLQSELAKVRALALQSNNDEMIKKIDSLITKSRLNMYEDASPTDIQLRMALKELGSMLSDIFPFFKASGAAVGSAAAGSKIGK